MFVELSVVEHVAVLVDLDERRASMGVRGAERVDHVLAIEVVRAGDETRLRTERHGERVERRVDRAHRCRLRDLADRRGGGVLALGEPVDPVVEQQDVEVHVAAQRVDQVVAADRQAVAVAGDHPHVEIGSRDRDAGGDRRRPPVDRVHPVGVHVVREAARTADARTGTRCSRAWCRVRASASGRRAGCRSRRNRDTSGPLDRSSSPSSW